jgi:hexosaminidase
VDVWQKEGFQVIGTSWYDWGNVQKFAKVLTDRKAMGLLQSTWAGWAMSVPLVSTGAYNQFVAYLLAAEEAWNGGVPVESLGYNPDDAFRQMWDRKPIDPNVYPGFSVGLGPGNAGWWSWMPRTSSGEGPSGALASGGVAFEVGGPIVLNSRLLPGRPAAVSVTLDRAASELQFLWAATHIAADGDLVATLRVTYADGTVEEAPLTYGNQFFAFTDTRGGASVTTAWRGKTPDGRPAVIRRWAWVNERPDATIASVSLISAGAESAPVLLGVTGVGVKA